MRIVCAASVFMGKEAFSTLGDTDVVPDEDITRDVLKDADALIIRTKTRVDEELLRGTGVAFIGSAASGTDHLDIDFLNQAEICWCSAEGCNANSAAEYVMAALFYLAQRHSLLLENLTLGVIGAGHIGSAVVRKAEAIGMSVLKTDPPLRELTGNQDYLPLEETLRQADILSLHVPLEMNGPCPTLHMANHRFFELVKPGCIFINTSRGEVADPDALLYSLQRGALSGAVLDVWDEEPFYRPDLLQEVDLGTPHIAGHSLEGRLTGTMKVYQQAVRFLEQEPKWSPGALPGGRGASELNLDARGRTEEEVLADIVRQVYDIAVDDRNLRAGISMDRQQRGRHFRQSRREYAVRREFPATTVSVRHASPTLQRKVTGLGFNWVRDG